jgi:dipeptidyl aminopeptidase/acylaminoacyl peptidase
MTGSLSFRAPGRVLLSALLLASFSAADVAAQGSSRAAGAAAPSAAASLPLQAGRTLNFTTNEGSWMSLDVSPDGSTIVFDLLGDLYTLPITGGRATRLTGGMGFDSQPRFSPDGRRVVFVSDRDGGDNVWIMSLDRSDTLQLTRGKQDRYQSPTWLPDGEYVVVTREVGGRGGQQGKLWMYHTRGGTGQALISEPANLRTLGAAPTPDGRYLWFAQRTGGWQYNSGMRDYQLAVYDRQSGDRTVQSSRYGGGFRPTISPDGRWLVYGTRHVAETALRIRDLNSGEERWLAHPVQRDEQESRATRDVLPGMAFTPDSRELVVSYGGRFWRVPVDGSAPREIPFEAEVDLPMGPLVEFTYPISDSAEFTCPADPRRRSLPGRPAARLHGAEPPVCDGLSERDPATGGEPGDRSAPARLVSGWAVDRIRHLVVRRGGAPVSHPCGRSRSAAAPHP